MRALEIHEVLRNRGVQKLHHANTVRTSCTFLQLGGLGSRGLLERRNLPQTPQDSDDLDKRLGIWNCVFVDHVDIHNRAGRVKGPNQYGPVLFVQDIDILLNLPEEAQAFVTKKNPVNFRSGEPQSERWFQSKEEFAAGFEFGTFGQMVVIQTPAEIVPFSNELVQVRLDDPNRSLQSGENARSSARARLIEAARNGGIEIAITPPDCNGACICEEKYRSYSSTYIEHLFG